MTKVLTEKICKEWLEKIKKGVSLAYLRRKAGFTKGKGLLR